MLVMLSRKSVFLLAVIASSAGMLLNLLSPAGAATLQNRSITISSGTPSASASHTYQMTPASAGLIGSISFEYCDNSPLIYIVCHAPGGLDLSGVNLSSQTGNTGFSIDAVHSTANKIVLTRPAGAANLVASTYVFDNVINPSIAGQTVFVRLGTYASQDASGSFTDNGAVAFAPQNIFTVGSYVPPFLKLCVGLTVAPDCSSFFGDQIDFGILSSNHASYGQSQFATGTNDPTGYNVYALGTTMTSGNNVITAVPNPAPSFPGTGQFGINLRANLLPPIGQDPVGLGTGAPTANYNNPNRFMFNNGDAIASSPLNTDYNRMTVSYLVNVSHNQSPGIYATTITYLAVVQF
jgi:hypothetical protein